MVNSIKGSRQIKQRQERDYVFIGSGEKVIDGLEKGCLGAMTGTVSRLMRIDCWSTYGSRAGGEQLSQGFWTGRRGLTLVCSFFVFCFFVDWAQSTKKLTNLLFYQL